MSDERRDPNTATGTGIGGIAGGGVGHGTGGGTGDVVAHGGVTGGGPGADGEGRDETGRGGGAGRGFPPVGPPRARQTHDRTRRVAYDHTGQVVLVTGGTKGIGAGIARAFLAAGAQVVVCARKRPEAVPAVDPAVAGIAGDPAPAAAAAFVQADVRDAAEVDRLIMWIEERYGRLDVVVNNAGGGPYAPVAETSPRLHVRVIELNLTAPLLVAQRAYPLLADSGGAVIMIGSSSGVRPSPGTSAYGAAKAGLHHLAACLAAEWAPMVRVNTVVVGLARTENAADHYGDAADRLAATIPAGRMALPEDVAAACLWLAAPGYVTGAQIAVHGGGETPAWRYLATGHDVGT
jgi:NAD(P)-dependent dehydrogenase (short-subunit alcohol dehydrogenase family)